MVFNDQSRNPFFNTVQSNLQVGNTIGNFEGQIWYDGANILGLNPAQFMYLKNMEYGISGSGRFVQTRTGNKVFSDIGKDIRSIGMNIIQSSDKGHFCYVDNYGNMNTLSIDTLSSKVISNGVYVGSYNDSFPYNAPGLETVYFSNENDGISKVYNINNPTYVNVFKQPITSICFSGMSGRQIAAYGHNVYYSNVQNQTALDTTNLEKFTDTNGNLQYITINPTDGQKIFKARDNGEATFFFKDTGIWALINSDEDPKNWIVPKCNADQGTLSPETIDYGQYGSMQGYIYLASDKTLRMFNGHVVRNAGVKPTLTDGDSKIISFPFQKLLDDIPDAYLSKCKGRFFDRFYILNFVSPTGNDLDSTIVIDTDKLFQMEGTDIAQPFWYYSDKYLCFTDSIIYKSRTLYGFHIDGYIVEAFSSNQFWDEAPSRITPSKAYITNDTINMVAIDWAGYTAWQKLSDYEINLYDAYVNLEVGGNWLVNFTTNSFVLGESIPAFDQGIVKSVYPYNLSGQFYNLDSYKNNYANVNGQMSINGFEEARGNFFSFGFYGNNVNEWAKIFSIEPRYIGIKSTPMGTNN